MNFFCELQHAHCTLGIYMYNNDVHMDGARVKESTWLPLTQKSPRLVDRYMYVDR